MLSQHFRPCVVTEYTTVEATVSAKERKCDIKLGCIESDNMLAYL